MGLDSAEIKKILVINLAFIGDVILSVPAIRALKETYPEARIDMLTVPVTVPVAKLIPYVDTVLEYDKRGQHKNILKLWQLIKKLRTQKYDLAVAMNFALRGAAVAWASGAHNRLGYDAQHAAMFLTHVASSARSEIRHETENYLSLLKPIGIEAEDARLELKITPEVINRVREKLVLEENQPLIIICPFGRNPLNCWTVEGNAETVRHLAGKARCILIGGNAEKNLLEQVKEMSGAKIEILAGALSIEELAALIKIADIMITVDTGPMHIAGAVGTPILSLVGRSDYRVWGPRGPRDIVLHNKVACWPCNNWKCDNNHLCMNSLTADKVVQAAVKMLADR